MTELAVFAPSTVVAVIFAVPIATAVTIPEELTVATAVLSEDQIMDLLLASHGETSVVSLQCITFVQGSCSR
jgi:hypothetical protein